MLPDVPGVCRIRLLGPLRVWDGAAWSSIRAAQQRVVLSILLIEAGRVVSTDRLVDEIWGEQPPRAAASVLRGYVMRLRRAMGVGTAGPLQTRQAGYELSIDDDDVDARVFDRLVGSGRQALSNGDPERAVADLSQARAMWHGAALADVPASPTVSAFAERLEQARLAATEDLIAGRLELGHHGDVVAELHRLVDEHPMRERLWEQLMVALYRAGRRGDALAAYRRARSSLVTALGLEPGPDLQQLHRGILADDRRLAVPARRAADRAGPGRIIPAHLPTDIAGFAGRDDQLKQLDALLPELTERLSPVLICVTGTAGVGKTTLAVHWAHRVAELFPDGQVFVNLRGFDPSVSVLGVGEAIRGLLEALQVPPQQIPATVEAQVGLYRSLLSGRRMLVLLDNARDTDQVRPLLPNSPGCLALVTSRNQLTGLVAADGAHPLALDLLTPNEGRLLLERRLSPDRVGAEPDSVAEIVTRCAGLPLALAIVAARAATHPQFGLATLAYQLRAAGDGLDAFADGDASTDVRTVFSWSYRALDTASARLFRLLALHPGADLGVSAAASLAGVSQPAVRPLLAELTRAHLISEHSPGRYGFHDLLRVYAAELGEILDGRDERRAATHRLLDHYLHSAHIGATLLDPHQLDDYEAVTPPGTAPERLTSHEQALAWFHVEHPVLVALVGRAVDLGFDDHACRLARVLAVYLHRSAHWREWADTQRTALVAAGRLGDLAAQARAHRGIARAESRLGRHAGAAPHLQQALDLLGQLGDQDGQAHTQLAFGLLRETQGRYRDALSHCEQALELFRAAGSRAGQGRALNSVGWCQSLLGDHRQAITSCQEALALLEDIDDRAGQASTWHSLAYSQHQLGRHEPATFCYRESLSLFQQLGDRYSEAIVLTHLGDVHQAVGHTTDAHAVWRRALAILDELGHPDAGQVRAKLPG
jgi:DNA-binding SARP family transcriptional activator/tetratricopeptide (TPR) repeat protein